MADRTLVLAQVLYYEHAKPGRTQVRPWECLAQGTQSRWLSVAAYVERRQGRLRDECERLRALNQELQGRVDELAAMCRGFTSEGGKE